MADYLKRSWAVVNLDKIEHNLAAIREILTPATKVMGVVKADAYGHGDKYIAKTLVESGADWLGVSNIEEALSLRTQGITDTPILVLGITPAENAAELIEYGITQTVHSLDYAKALNEKAAELGAVIDIHIKMDTGMSRLGFVLTNGYQVSSEEDIFAVSKLSNLKIDGIYTHFSCADEVNAESDAFTQKQFELFLQSVENLQERGVKFNLRHCCNSAAALRFPHMHLDMIRPGIILYGLNPSRDVAGIIPLKPAMDLCSCITMVKEVEEGTTVSYGGIYTAHRKMKIATVPIGYADGYARELSNKSRTIVRGRFANLIGRVCMDQLMLDVTHIKDVTEGDTVTIVGTDGPRTLTFDEMADLCGTINYEKVCLIGKRVPRIYTKNGENIGVVDLIHRGQLITVDA